MFQPNLPFSNQTSHFCVQNAKLPRAYHGACPVLAGNSGITNGSLPKATRTASKIGGGASLHRNLLFSQLYVGRAGLEMQILLKMIF